MNQKGDQDDQDNEDEEDDQEDETAVESAYLLMPLLVSMLERLTPDKLSFTFCPNAPLGNISVPLSGKFVLALLGHLESFATESTRNQWISSLSIDRVLPMLKEECDTYNALENTNNAFAFLVDFSKTVHTVT